MSDAQKDGGPAFPFSPNDHSTANYIAPGMSLRDWFAGQALIGLLGDKAWREKYRSDWFAAAAYKAADAMLEARK